MINAIEIRGRWARAISRPASLGHRIAAQAPVRHLVSRIEATGYALVGQRALSIIAVCTIVWLASVCLAATIAQAQESSSNSASVTALEPAIGRRSIEKEEAGNLVLGMLDRGDLEPGAYGNSTVQLTNPHPADSQKAGKVLLPCDLRGIEYTSLAVLASAPQSLLSTVQAKDSPQADTISLTNNSKAVVYRFGGIDFEVNQLPSSFSMSSPGNGLPGTR